MPVGSEGEPEPVPEPADQGRAGLVRAFRRLCWALKDEAPKRFAKLEVLSFCSPAGHLRCKLVDIRPELTRVRSERLELELEHVADVDPRIRLRRSAEPELRNLVRFKPVR